MKKNYPIDSPNRLAYLQDFFEFSADAIPSAVGVDDHGETYSYGFMEERANRIAHTLLEAGCGPNDRVCISTGKNINLYCSVLGTLKSGACWVPLGENFPLERLQYLIESVAPKVVIAEGHTLEKVLSIRDMVKGRFEVILLGDSAGSREVLDERAVNDKSPTRPVLRQRSPEDLAYIIFTSGSTGMPKGVMVYHRNITLFLNLCFDFFHVEPGSRFAHHSELTFDPSLFDLFYCWATGGILVPFNRRRYRIDPCAFAGENRINVWFSVPTVFKSLDRAGRIGSEQLSSIKHLILTGEPMQTELVNKWRGAYPDCEIYNVYGTTETAIISHWYRVEGDLDPEQPMPVGTPLPGVHVMLLDGDRPVEPGEPGESVVYGTQISPGYWRNEAENKTRFVPNPLDPSLPQTVYRSGDLLRQRDDGIYVYVGRADRQVKVRGHRIELGEVENIMLPYPGIEEVAVVAVEESSDIPEAHLVAFVVADDISFDGLKAYLAEKLPLYMMPSKIERVQGALPRNENKKVDYLQLNKIARKK